MLYYLIDFLEQQYQPAGFQVVYFITVRAGLAAGTALVISLFAGKRIIRWLQDHQFKEHIREGQMAGAVDHSHKAGTPTMGGIIILLAVVGSTLLWGAIGEGLHPTHHPRHGLDGSIRFCRRLYKGRQKRQGWAQKAYQGYRPGKPGFDRRSRTLLPSAVRRGQFAHEPAVFDRRDLRLRRHRRDFRTRFLAPVVYILVVVFIVTALSNAANLTDGLDGLAAGVASVVSVGLLLLCYVAGNAIFSDFLNMMFLPGTGELTVFAAALTASGFGFLWYNGYPAQVFMGDTGSMALGAAIGTLALMIKIELLLPLLCAAFFVETLSVIIQTSWFRYTRKRRGVGRRVFRMAPIHHHYEALGIPESKIVIRFWIVTAILVIATLLTFRIR